VGADNRRATSIIPGFKSIPTTRPPRPTRSAATRATTPVPQATSKRRSPHGDIGGIDQQWCPWAQNVANDHPLVALSRFGAEVPLLVLAHFGFQPSLRDMRSAVCVTDLICALDGEAEMY
jgi:hypothetical protein